MIIKFILIQIIVCFVIDCSGFIQSMEDGISRWVGARIRIPKPFSCSLCLGFWTNTIVLICTGFSLEYFAVICLLAFFSKNITGFLNWLSELLVKVENLLYRMIEK